MHQTTEEHLCLSFINHSRAFLFFLVNQKFSHKKLENFHPDQYNKFINLPLRTKLKATQATSI
jgi:hypothetical protein